MTLDRAKLTAIGHADHVICNPVSFQKVDGVLDLLDLPPGARVLDAGCGKAEILIRLIERRGGGIGTAGPSVGGRMGSKRGTSIKGVGVDMNARLLEEGRRAAAKRVPAGSLDLIEGDVAVYLESGADAGEPQGAGSSVRTRERSGRGAGTPTSTGRRARSGTGGERSGKGNKRTDARTHTAFDAALCTGSTHAFGGYRQTLRALACVVQPGGQLLIGEGYWRKDPEAEYLTALGTTRAEFHDHAGNVAVGVEEGLVPLYSTVSSGDEWDRYEGLYLRAVERYIASHPRDPDTPELRDHIRRWRDAYLRWGRDTLGFGLYLFRRE